MTVTITEAVFDGQIIHIAYTITSPTALDLTSWDYHLMYDSIIFDGEELVLYQWGGSGQSLGRICNDTYQYGGIHRILLPELVIGVKHAEVSVYFGFGGSLATLDERVAVEQRLPGNGNSWTTLTFELDILPRTLVEVVDGYLFADTDFYSQFKITDVSISPLGVFIYTYGSWQHNFTVGDNLSEQHSHTYQFDGSATWFSDGSGIRSNWRLFPFEIHPDATELIVQRYSLLFDGIGYNRIETPGRLVIPLP